MEKLLRKYRDIIVKESWENHKTDLSVKNLAKVFKISFRQIIRILEMGTRDVKKTRQAEEMTKKLTTP